MDNKAMYKLSYGLFVLTAKQGDKDNGCIINTAIQAASGPNQISVCINKGNYTHDMVLATGEFTVSVISQSASFDLFKRFGFQSGRDVDKFEGYSNMTRGANGLYYITEGTNAFISVKVEKAMDLGSHTMVIGTVTDMEVLSPTASATYAYYMDHIKPKPEPVGKTEDGQTVWRCRICGYEYVGDEIPADFICPICKHPAADFEKVIKANDLEKVIKKAEEPEKEKKEDKTMAVKFYRCQHCGNIIEKVNDSGVPVVCCGEPMKELVPGTSDGAFEKHVPVVEVEGNVVTVKVGAMEHPMAEVHYIQWIEIETTAGIQRKNLVPGAKPEAKFILADGEACVAAYEYCNLHGLWKAE